MSLLITPKPYYKFNKETLTWYKVTPEPTLLTESDLRNKSLKDKPQLNLPKIEKREKENKRRRRK